MCSRHSRFDSFSLKDVNIELELKYVGRMEECLCAKLVAFVLQGSIWANNGWDPYNAKVTNYMKNNVCQEEEEGIKVKAVNINTSKFRKLYYLLLLLFICIVKDFKILDNLQWMTPWSTLAIVSKPRLSIINNWPLVLSSFECIITLSLCTLILNTEWSAGCY